MAPDEYIFVSTNPGQGRASGATGEPLHDDYINTLFKGYASAAHLDTSRLSVHSLRHAAARERYDAGADIRSIQQVLDHYSLATTDTYLRKLAPVDDSGARLLEQRYGL